MDDSDRALRSPFRSTFNAIQYKPGIVIASRTPIPSKSWTITERRKLWPANERK